MTHMTARLATPTTPIIEQNPLFTLEITEQNGSADPTPFLDSLTQLFQAHTRRIGPRQCKFQEARTIPISLASRQEQARD